MITLLQNNLHLLERVNANIDIYPSDGVLKEFQLLAKQIDADRYFTIYGCQECNRALVKFVFDNQDKLEPAVEMKLTQSSKIIKQSKS